jgi:hypothetical protein
MPAFAGITKERKVSVDSGVCWDDEGVRGVLALMED